MLRMMQTLNAAYEIANQYLFPYTPNRRLLDAIDNQSLEEVKEALAAGANINANQKDGVTGTPLGKAILHDDLAIVSYLLEHGADANQSYDTMGTFSITPLNLANIMNNVAVFTRLVEGGANIHAQSDLIFAAIPHQEILTYLLEKGSSVNAISQGKTPLIAAISAQVDIDTIKLLVKHGANINEATSETTALIKAIEEAKLNVATYLLNQGTDINQSCHINTPLIKAIRMKASHHIYFPDMDAIKYLIDKGANINSVEKKHNRTPLIVAVIENDIETVRLLLANHAKVNEKDDTGNTALHYAAMNHYNDIISILHHNGADGQLKNNQGETILKWMYKDYAGVQQFFFSEKNKNNHLNNNTTQNEAATKNQYAI